MIDSFARLFFVLCDAEHGKLHEKDSLTKQEFMEAVFRSPAMRIHLSAMGLEVACYCCNFCGCCECHYRLSMMARWKKTTFHCCCLGISGG